MAERAANPEYEAYHLVVAGQAVPNALGPELFEGVIDLLDNQLGCGRDKIKLDALLVDDLNADSLDLVELVMSIEEFMTQHRAELSAANAPEQFEISDEDAELIGRVRHIFDYTNVRVLGDKTVLDAWVVKRKREVNAYLEEGGKAPKYKDIDE